jgi:hypothetical protein
LSPVLEKFCSGVKAVKERRVLVFELGRKTRRLLRRIFVGSRVFNITGGNLAMKFTLKDDQIDFGFTISQVSAVDSKGRTLALVENLASDAPNVVDVVFDDGSSASNPRSGKGHLGGDTGKAVVTYQVTVADTGEVAKSVTAEFNIIAGKVATVTGGDFVFSGITPDPEPAPTPNPAPEPVPVVTPPPQTTGNTQFSGQS